MFSRYLSPSFSPLSTLGAEDQQGEPIAEDASIDALSTEEDGHPIQHQSIRKHVSSSRHLWIFIIDMSILLTAIAFFLMSSATKHQAKMDLEYSRMENRNFEAHCNERISTYSPALEYVSFKTVDFKADPDLGNVYRGEPRPELDTAWQRLLKGGSFPVQEDLVRRINKSATLGYAAKFPEETGGGYVARLEMYHQMQCVNLLRQYTYKEYYEEEIQAFTAGLASVRMHLDHCIDVLRQVVMCNADVTLVTEVWVEGSERPVRDFNTQHKCRDYEALLQWNEAAAARPESYGNVKKPEGVKEMPMPAWMITQE